MAGQTLHTGADVEGLVTGVESGNVKDHLQHVASAMLSKYDERPPYVVDCIHITKADGKNLRRSPSFIDRWFRGSEKRDNDSQVLSIRGKALGPLAYVTLLGCALTIIMRTLSLLFGDGWSLMATVSLSLLSSLVRVANKWHLQLAKRKRNDEVPRADLVVRYIRGKYLVVRCDEQIARELFFAPEEIRYELKSEARYRLVALTGTMLLMFGVIALANARLELQFAWAGSYILINAAHWGVAALRARDHWGFEDYDVKPDKVVEVDLDNPNTNPDREQMERTFTGALWQAICASGSAAWCRHGAPAAPMTAAWDAWLQEAEKEARSARKNKKKSTWNFQYAWEKHQGLQDDLDISKQPRVFTAPV